ncbi:N-formylglutamate amidohydrolase [Aurantiacibacter spongiae]|nr:N-formylglutamate amidohydrolase [Aurantiacibacter spongiae]
MSSDRIATTGGSIPGEGAHAPAFTFSRPGPGANAIPVLVAVPHAGRAYPATLTAAMRHPDEAKLRLEDRLVDRIADQVAHATGAALLVAHAPRAMIDLNRSPDDVDWEMVADARRRAPRHSTGRRARNGLGLVPRRLPGLGELWSGRLAAADLSERIEAVHRPYHARLSQGLESLRDRWGAALLIDMHSMPPLGPKPGEGAADFVVGDRFGASCQGRLSAETLRYLAREGRLAAHNRPYAGGYVLDRHGAPARGIGAIQLEICRTTYLDARLREPGPGMADVVTLLSGLVRALADGLARSGSLFAQAAE